MTVYERIQELSKEHGLSVRELGRKLDIGETTIYKWKTQSPKLVVLEKVADYFDVSVDYLVGRTETKSTQSNDLISIEKPEVRSLARRMNDFDDDELRIIVSDHRLIRCDLSDKTCGTHAASRCIILHIGEDCGDGS